jgi:hypothetical protein
MRVGARSEKQVLRLAQDDEAKRAYAHLETSSDVLGSERFRKTTLTPSLHLSSIPTSARSVSGEM